MFPPLAILSSAYLARIEETGHISKAFIICHVVFALITTGAVAFVPFSPEGGPIVHYAIAGLMVLSPSSRQAASQKEGSMPSS